MISSNQLLPVTITPRAIAQVKHIMETKGISAQEYGLRVGVRGGGCSGSSFILGFDEHNTKDNQYTIEGLSMYIDKKHLMYVIGLEIDFEEVGDESGFVFNNPDAKTVQS